jgi:hypothetical protein
MEGKMRIAGAILLLFLIGIPAADWWTNALINKVKRWAE